MSEEIKNVAEETPVEAPVQKETKKAVLNASVAPEDFDWDAFENEGVEKGSKEETLAKYEQTLSKVTENEVVEGVVTSINKREVVVNIGAKSEGVISAPEFRYNPDLKVGDKVEVLVESAEDRKGQQRQVQTGVFPDHCRAEAVDEILQEVLVFVIFDGPLFDQEEAQNAKQGDDAADDTENDGPAFRKLLIQSHKAAEHGQNGHQGHHGVDAFGLAPVGMVGGVGEPGVEAGIVGGGAEEGHDAVHDDH